MDKEIFTFYGDIFVSGLIYIVSSFSDPDGDCVAFSTDEELCEALGFVNDGILKVYVRAIGKILPLARQSHFLWSAPLVCL